MISKLSNFLVEGSDHLCRQHVTSSQDRARESVCTAARVFQFISATKLRPSRGYDRAYPKGVRDKRIPGQDHVNVWFDDQKRYLITDEPYEDRLELRRKERDAWCNSNNYEEIKATWSGIHYPSGGTWLYLLSNKEKGAPLEPVAKALEQLPAPYSVLNWLGESAESTPIFFSPGRLAKQSQSLSNSLAAHTKPRALAKDEKQLTLEYILSFVGPRRRPNGRMPVQAHREVGQLLKEVLVITYYRKGVYNRINKIRSELDEWTMREYDYSELPNEEFHDLYYEESGYADSAKTISSDIAKQCLEKLHRTKSLLLEHYPNCAPLRRLINLMSESEKSLLAWVSAKN